MMCHRCQGLLVCHTFYGLSIKADAHYATTRCINCGHIEDAVVRANRIRASVSTPAPLHGRVATGDVERIKIHQKEPTSLR